MSKTTVSAAAIAAILALATPVAFAQPSGSGANTNSAADQVQPGQFRVSQLNGATVFDLHNLEIGTVRNIVLDPRGRVAAVAIKLGSNAGNGNANRTIAVRMTDLKATTVNGKPQLLVTKTAQQLDAAPTYVLNPQTNNGNTNNNGQRAVETRQASQILADNLNGRMFLTAATRRSAAFRRSSSTPAVPWPKLW